MQIVAQFLSTFPTAVINNERLTKLKVKKKNVKWKKSKYNGFGNSDLLATACVQDLNFFLKLNFFIVHALLWR